MSTPDLFGTSPFDALRRVSPEGREYWSGRDLMPHLGYEKWERFEGSIARAELAAHAQGVSVGFSRLREHLAGGTKPREDVHLSRFAAYLVAMNGDPRKPEVAAAQAYFAVKTREAETAPPAVDLATITRRDLALMIVAAEDERDAAVARAEVAETQVQVLAPAAQAWADVTNAEGSWSAGDAAKILRNAGIMTGQNRLFEALDRLGWTFKRGESRHIKQPALDQGLLVLKVYPPRYKPNGERQQVDPQIRITGKGIDRLIRDLGTAA